MVVKQVVEASRAPYGGPAENIRIEVSVDFDGAARMRVVLGVGARRPGAIGPPRGRRRAGVGAAGGGRRDPGRGAASLLRPLPHIAGARGDGRALPHLENRIPAMMAPGLRRLRTPLPRHRAFVPPPALPGGRPCGSPLRPCGLQCALAQPVRRRLAATAFGGRSSSCPGSRGVSLYGGAACSKVWSRRPPPRSRKPSEHRPDCRALRHRRYTVAERRLDNRIPAGAVPAPSENRVQRRARRAPGPKWTFPPTGDHVHSGPPPRESGWTGSKKPPFRFDSGGGGSTLGGQR